MYCRDNGSRQASIISACVVSFFYVYIIVAEGLRIDQRSASRDSYRVAVVHIGSE